MTGKRCTRCLEWKPRTAFYQDRTKADGRKAQCKDCRRAYKRQYRARQRAAARVRLKRQAFAAWRRPSAGPGVTPQALKESMERWRARTRLRRQAYLDAAIRRWHAENAAASRAWHRSAPEFATATRQARRADAMRVPVNDFSPREWRWLIEAYGHRCAYCGQPGDSLTPDHVTPLAQGGHNTLANVVPACLTCNTRKGARTPAEAGMRFAVRMNVTRQLEQMPLI